MNNQKMDTINDTEFASLYQKSKKLIDNARSNMGQMENAITVINFGMEDKKYGRESKCRI